MHNFEKWQNFKNLVVLLPQEDFENVFAHFLILCMKRLNKCISSRENKKALSLFYLKNICDRK